MLSSLESAVATLAAADLDATRISPVRTDASTPSWPHAPFARLLVSGLRPRSIVDVAVADGGSFAAFCDAVEVSGTEARCYAVEIRSAEGGGERRDNLAGAPVLDGHAGFAAILSGRSGLLAGLFASGSVDLLHLGGIHTGRSLDATLRTWMPTLSGGGVLLIHNTLESADAGVRQSWHRLREAHPSFEFRHGGGLGIVAPGAKVPDIVAKLADLTAEEGALLGRQLADLAERWSAIACKQRGGAGAETGSREALAALRQQLSSSRQETDRLRAQIEGIRTSVSWRVTGPYRVIGRMLKSRLAAPPAAPAWKRQEGRDFERISRSPLFDASFYLGRDSVPAERGDAIRSYLAASRKAMPRGRQNPGAPPRRPVPGFHPLAYAARCLAYDETRHGDPLAHYLRTGLPDGPWKHPVIRKSRPSSSGPGGLRVLVHAHFHYPDLVEDFLRRLRRNASRVDVLITTGSDRKADAIEAVLKQHGVRASILVSPNVGRDIGPLLMHFDRCAGYDVVGHLHGKRSPQQTGGRGDNWRDFLWEHLVGGGHPMLDVIVEAFAEDAGLGLLLAEDPNLNHWDMNWELAETLARRMGLRDPLPPHFEFPKGTMFYVRPAALRPLVDLGWSWDDFPAEPARSDGTVLHALERLVTFSAKQVGYGLKSVHVPGSWRLPEL